MKVTLTRCITLPHVQQCAEDIPRIPHVMGSSGATCQHFNLWYLSNIKHFNVLWMYPGASPQQEERERDKVSELYPEDTFLRLGTAAARHWDLSPDSEALENFKAAAMHQHNLPSSFWNRQCLSSTSTMDFCVHAIFQPEHTISLQTPNCSDKKSTFACDNVCNPSSSK